jgi:hypothetical protein
LNTKGLQEFLGKAIPRLSISIEEKTMILITLLLVFKHELKDKNDTGEFKRINGKDWRRRYFVLEKLLNDGGGFGSELANLIMIWGESYKNNKVGVNELLVESKTLHTGVFDDILTIDEAKTRDFWT